MRSGKIVGGERRRERGKERLEQISHMLEITWYAAAISAVILGAAYFIFPESKRQMEQLFGFKAWYFQADFSIAESSEGVVADFDMNTFYHDLWDKVGRQGKLRLGKVDLADSQSVKTAVENQLSGIVGDIIRRFRVTEPLYGRENPDATSRSATMLPAGGSVCAKVLDVSVSMDPARPYPNQIWLKLVKVDCL